MKYTAYILAFTLFLFLGCKKNTPVDNTPIDEPEYLWTIYNTENSDIPSNRIQSIVIDKSGKKIIGTGGGGLVVFNDNEWIIYDKSNSPIPHNYVNTIALDASGNKWIGTDGGIAFFDDSQ